MLVDAVIAGLYAALFLGFSFAAARPELTHLPWLARHLGGSFSSFSMSPRLELLSYASLGLMLASAVALAFRRLRPRAWQVRSRPAGQRVCTCSCRAPGPGTRHHGLSA